MAIYRKRPVLVEAIEWRGNYPSSMEIKDFVGKKNAKFEVIRERVPKYNIPEWLDLKIHTLEGDMQAEIGDYIIKGVNGEFYPCKPAIFEKIYEKVSKKKEASLRKMMRIYDIPLNLADFVVDVSYNEDEDDNDK